MKFYGQGRKIILDLKLKTAGWWVGLCAGCWAPFSTPTVCLSITVCYVTIMRTNTDVSLSVPLKYCISVCAQRGILEHCTK